MYCEQKRPTYYWCIAERVFIDPDKDYEIEMKVKPYQVNSLTSEFGLLFGLKNVSMFNAFTASASGDVSVRSKVYDTEIPYLSPFPISTYRSGDWCTFKISNKQGRMYFYFNDRLVYERKKIDMMGRWFGWYTNGQTGIQIDYFYVKQDRGVISLCPESSEYKKERIKGVNSEKDEVSPRVSEDGKFFYFGRYISSNSSFYSVYKDGNLGFYSTEADSTGNLSTPEKLQIPLKNPWYIANVPKDQSFFVGEKDNFFTSNGNQLSMFNLNTNTIETSNSVRFSRVNHVAIRNVSISKDGNVMVMSGYENYEPYGLDLYVSFKSGTEWSIPKKIVSLNTKGDELTPFISHDMKKIYFSSDGHPGYGFTDVFVANRQDDSWLSWSKPMNLGKNVNDAGFNEFFVMPDTSKSRFAYMSSTHNNVNNLDLFKVTVKKTMELPAYTIAGKIIYSEETKEKIKTLELSINGTNKKTLSVADPNQEFSCAIKKDDKFSVRLTDTNFVILEQKVSETFGSKNQKEVTVKVARIKKGESFVLENIYFTANKFELLPESYPALDALVQIMLNNKKIKIEIQGHTSKTNESDKFNLELSTQRAVSVKKYLLAKGIEEKRLTAVGYGYTKPKFTDDNLEHQAANRRVEIKILEK